MGKFQTVLVWLVSAKWFGVRGMGARKYFCVGGERDLRAGGNGAGRCISDYVAGAKGAVEALAEDGRGTGEGSERHGGVGGIQQAIQLGAAGPHASGHGGLGDAFLVQCGTTTRATWCSGPMRGAW